MKSLRRKRKGLKALSAIGSHLSDNGDHGRNIRKKCKMESCNAKGGILMTAPPSMSSSPLSPNRGHKRKLGCIESSTRIIRKKKLEHEYVLGASIGQGKFGSVRLCRSKATGEEFAVKTLKKNGEESVHKEVEIMRHLSGHPNIVTLRSVFEDSENFHLVMELCKEGRLLDRMKEGRFSEQMAARLVKNLVGVIKYCHEMGVVHRDVKPENILMMGSGEIKLADFGLAVRVASGEDSENFYKPVLIYWLYVCDNYCQVLVMLNLLNGLIGQYAIIVSSYFLNVAFIDMIVSSIYSLDTRGYFVLMQVHLVIWMFGIQAGFATKMSVTSI